MILESSISDRARIPKVVVNSNLMPVGTRPTLNSYIRNIWILRYFTFKYGRLRSLSGGRGTLLGRLWLLLEPFLRIAMYFVIFSVLLSADRGIDNFVGFLAIGIIMFTPIASSLNSGASFASRNRGLIKAFSFPRATLVFSESVRDLVDSIPEVFALLLFLLLIPPHETPNVFWLTIPLLLILRQVLISGIVFVTASINCYVPDFRNLWPLVSRFWFYGSGVVFPIQNFVDDPVMKTLLTSNPGFILIGMARQVLLHSKMPPLSEWIQMIGWSVCLFSLGILFFWASERRMNRVG